MKSFLYSLKNRKFSFGELFVVFLVMLSLGGVFSYVSIWMNNAKPTSSTTVERRSDQQRHKSSILHQNFSQNSLQRVGDLRMDLLGL